MVLGLLPRRRTRFRRYSQPRDALPSTPSFAMFWTLKWRIALRSWTRLPKVWRTRFGLGHLRLSCHERARRLPLLLRQDCQRLPCVRLRITSCVSLLKCWISRSPPRRQIDRVACHQHFLSMLRAILMTSSFLMTARRLMGLKARLSRLKTGV